MGYKELKELVIKKLEENPNYLDEQIDILDGRVALLKAIEVVPEQIEDDDKILEMLFKIKEEIGEK